MEAIVHIGAPKTGTSSIQKVLRLRHEALKAHGIYTWPHDPRSLFGIFEDQSKPLIPDERLIRETRAAFTEWSAGMWARLEEEVAASSARAAILSCEHFIYARDKQALWARLSRLFDRVTVIAYMRDPLDLYPSVINQRIRGGFRFAGLPTPGEFPFGGYRRLLEHRALLGAEAIYVKNYSKPRHKADIIGSFFGLVESLLGQDVPHETAETKENAGLSAQAILWLLTANEGFDLRGRGVTRAQIAQRNEVLERLRALEGPGLSLQAPSAMRACVEEEARTYREVLNAEFLDPEDVMEAPAGASAAPSGADQRDLLKDWLLSHLEAGELKRTADILLQAGAGHTP